MIFDAFETLTFIDDINDATYLKSALNDERFDTWFKKVFDIDYTEEAIEKLWEQGYCDEDIINNILEVIPDCNYYVRYIDDNNGYFKIYKLNLTKFHNFIYDKIDHKYFSKEFEELMIAERI